MRNILNYKLFESSDPIESICRRHRIRNWTLNPDGTIDVDGDVDLAFGGLTKLPIKFGRVTGYFDCSNNNLTSLEGSPKEVFNFRCRCNNLTSLVGSPEYIGSDFDCSENNLTSLEGSPKEIGESFDCSYNKLTNLEGCPEIIGLDFVSVGNNIYSLDFYPKVLRGQLYTFGNPIYEIWDNVMYLNRRTKLERLNHGHYLDIFDLHGPIQFEGGEWVCHTFRLNNFYDEIGAPQLTVNLKNYKEV